MQIVCHQSTQQAKTTSNSDIRLLINVRTSFKNVINLNIQCCNMLSHFLVINYQILTSHLLKTHGKLTSKIFLSTTNVSVEKLLITESSTVFQYSKSWMPQPNTFYKPFLQNFNTSSHFITQAVCQNLDNWLQEQKLHMLHSDC